MGALVVEAASLIGLAIAAINAPIVPPTAGADDGGRSAEDADHPRSLRRRDRRRHEEQRSNDVAVA
ncbi:MAG: hypothetical protein ABJH68_06480 [Ilumatobacter sp.]|uniref:hypothetical protein n=1 Tax=Ilumatobacter sp. TaxID=1967498 RepID=UPI0032979466